MPSSALDEDEADIRVALERGAGLLASLEGQVVGCARFRFDPPESSGSSRPRLFFSRLCVVPEARRRGVARSMLSALEAEARAAGADGLAMTVRSQQPDNRPFWLRLGFVITGYSERYGIEDMVTHMERPILEGRPKAGVET